MRAANPLYLIQPCRLSKDSRPPQLLIGVAIAVFVYIYYYAGKQDGHFIDRAEKGEHPGWLVLV